MKVRALVIEDSPVLRNILMQSLRQSQLADFEFTVACDGVEGLTKYQPGEFDILFVDWNMPRMNGLDFVREVRARETAPPIPICMVTTEKGIEKVDEAIQGAGATAYITKPFTIDDLRKTLSPLLDGGAAGAGAHAAGEASPAGIAAGEVQAPKPSPSLPEPPVMTSPPGSEPALSRQSPSLPRSGVTPQSGPGVMESAAESLSQNGERAAAAAVVPSPDRVQRVAVPSPGEPSAASAEEGRRSPSPMAAVETAMPDGGAKRSQLPAEASAGEVTPSAPNGATVGVAEPAPVARRREPPAIPTADWPLRVAPPLGGEPAPRTPMAPAESPANARAAVATADSAPNDRPSAVVVRAQDEMDRERFLAEFLKESHANLDLLQSDLAAMAGDPDPSEAIRGIFRTVHTLKGGCGSLRLPKLEALSHAAEELLTRLRDGRLPLDQPAQLALGDYVHAGRECLAALAARRDEGVEEYGPLIERLLTMARRAPAGPALPAVPPQRFGDLLVSQGRLRPEELEAALLQQMRGDPRHLGEILVERGLLQPHEVRETLRLQEAARSGTLPGDAVRIERHLLDRFSELVADLGRVVTLVLPPGRRPSEALADLGACRLHEITADLQRALLEASTQSLGELWPRLRGPVGEVAASCGKQVRLETAGDAIRIERHLTEPLREALLHLLRNAVDHGIESPDWRIACGKSPEGRVTLAASVEGDEICLEIADDGAGIDPNQLKRRALALELITPQYAAGMSSHELLALVFTPGFSTAEQVTKLSGRGIGLDVVKHGLEKLGGSVDLCSRPGAGTTVQIRLPRGNRVPLSAPPPPAAATLPP